VLSATRDTSTLSPVPSAFIAQSDRFVPTLHEYTIVDPVGDHSGEETPDRVERIVNPVPSGETAQIDVPHTYAILDPSGDHCGPLTFTPAGEIATPLVPFACATQSRVAKS